jgi:large conductance mechanosensitive channel
MIKEFKEFAIKWNMIDMAIWIMIWAAFSTIVKSLVDDIIMPVISGIFKIPDFSNLFVVLSNPSGETFSSVALAREAWASVLAYGLFINAILAFLMVSVTLFFVVKGINKLKKSEKKVEEPKISELDVLIDIRDQLKKTKWK